ncbi:MAG TPA: Eco57I restriction-modification methylase domain-containing protein, partial [Polyangium sp.]|nr:Eco57I restriction-modification methylase domain-containing protein [Polyangium sp.]
IDAVEKKEADWDRFTESKEYTDAWLLADAWCAAFVWPKEKAPALDEKMSPAERAAAIEKQELTNWAITWDSWRRISADVSSQMHKTTRKKVRELSQAYSFFHWHLAFPQVFLAGQGVPDKDKETGWAGGFDVVLGNPPWERVKLQEKEWFSQRNRKIADATSSALRKKLIEELKSSEPTLYSDFLIDVRKADGESHALRNSNRYPFCGRGDINLYAVFAETMNTIVGNGRVGCIVPTGIATDDTTKFFFQYLVQSQRLVSIYDFENRQGLFPTVDSNMKFCLLTTERNAMQGSQMVEFVFFAQAVGDLADADKRFSLSSEDIALLNPNTRTCPTFRSSKDANITRAIYRRVPILLRSGENEKLDDCPWGVRFKTMFHMSNDSNLFRVGEDLERNGWSAVGNIFRKGTSVYLPLYEAKMMHLFDHRFANAAEPKGGAKIRGSSEYFSDSDHVQPDLSAISRFWVDEQHVKESFTSCGWDRQWVIGFRNVTGNVANIRTSVFAILPYAAYGHSLPLVLFPASTNATDIASLAGCLTSFIFDYATRQKLGGINLTFFILHQLPVLPPSTYQNPAQWSRETLLRDWILPRVLELTYTAWDLEAFGKDCGYEGPPFRWDEQRRFLLRCELDAAFFHLYGIGRDDVDYIMETFPIVKRKDVAVHGDYRTKTQILDIYDRMQRAIETGEPYQTLLDPPPADPRVAHPPREKKDEPCA